METFEKLQDAYTRLQERLQDYFLWPVAGVFGVVALVLLLGAWTSDEDTLRGKAQDVLALKAGGVIVGAISYGLFAHLGVLPWSDDLTLVLQTAALGFGVIAFLAFGVFLVREIWIEGALSGVERPEDLPEGYFVDDGQLQPAELVDGALSGPLPLTGVSVAGAAASSLMTFRTRLMLARWLLPVIPFVAAGACAWGLMVTLSS